jgi:hypothetical protein
VVEALTPQHQPLPMLITLMRNLPILSKKRKREEQEGQQEDRLQHLKQSFEKLVNRRNTLTKRFNKEMEELAVKEAHLLSESRSLPDEAPKSGGGPCQLTELEVAMDTLRPLDLNIVTIEEIRKRLNIESPDQLHNFSGPQHIALLKFLKEKGIRGHRFHTNVIPKPQDRSSINWFFRQTFGYGRITIKILAKYRNLYVLFKLFKFPEDEEVPDLSAFGLIRTRATGG